MLLVLLVTTMSMAGCFGAENVEIEVETEPEMDKRIFVTDGMGMAVDEMPLEMDLSLIHI